MLSESVKTLIRDEVKTDMIDIISSVRHMIEKCELANRSASKGTGIMKMYCADTIIPNIVNSYAMQKTTDIVVWIDNETVEISIPEIYNFIVKTAKNDLLSHRL